jgi:hypothetical protein
MGNTHVAGPDIDLTLHVNGLPTKMGGPGAPDDLAQAHVTQDWLAVSEDGARSSAAATSTTANRATCRPSSVPPRSRMSCWTSWRGSRARGCRLGDRNGARRTQLGAHSCASRRACDSARRATTLSTSRRIAALLAWMRNQ